MVVRHGRVHTLSWGQPAADAYVMVEASCRYTCGDDGQDHSKHWDTEAVTGALAVSVHSHGCRVSLQVCTQ